MTLINREDLIAEYDRVHVGEPGGARKLMVDAPEAQSEIVIPCVDCANWIPGFITDNDDFVPPKCGKYQQMVGHDSNDFCSLAERRTDERQT